MIIQFEIADSIELGILERSINKGVDTYTRLLELAIRDEEPYLIEYARIYLQSAHELQNKITPLIERFPNTSGHV